MDILKNEKKNIWLDKNSNFRYDENKIMSHTAKGLLAGLVRRVEEDFASVFTMNGYRVIDEKDQV